MENNDFLSTEKIVEILNTAMDSGDWHTPHATDVKLSELSNSGVAYGWCNISLHNNYHYVEHWFNINSTSVQIWKKEYQKGKIEKSLHRPIYNMQKLIELLNK